jgi:hypothetical protein
MSFSHHLVEGTLADYDNEQTLDWRKSTRSDTHGCMEIALDGGMVLVRDSKRPYGPILSISPRAWAALLAQVRSSSLVIHAISDPGDERQGVPRTKRDFA